MAYAFISSYLLNTGLYVAWANNELRINVTYDRVSFVRDACASAQESQIVGKCCQEVNDNFFGTKMFAHCKPFQSMQVRKVCRKN